MADGGSFAARAGALAGVPVADIQPAGERHGFRHLRGTLADGRRVFIKASSGGEGSESGKAFAAEANGLRWLAEASAVPLPEVLGVDERMLIIGLLPEEAPSPAAARDLGASLARMHAAGAPAFGAPWPGYIASLPLDNTAPDNTALGHPDNSAPLRHAENETPPSHTSRTSHTTPHSRSRNTTPAGLSADTDWGSWYAERRIVPYLQRAYDDGALSGTDARQVTAVIDRIGELAGPPEPPSRIHGDLWSGNVLWSGGGGALIDPAAHGGHRETDLAMLALFGAPYLDAILGAYSEAAPLADGWRSRVPLHQLHPLLVHVCLFGPSYTPQLTAAARAALRA
jgi:fructosamine-3-kinase